MKKIASLILALVLALTALTACGAAPAGDASRAADAGNDSPAVTEAEEIKNLRTIGEVLSLASAEHRQSATMDNTHVYVFEMDGTLYRVVAHMPQETFDAIIALDVTKDDYDEELKKLISPLVIDSYENLSTAIPSQKLLDELVGKTGAELLDDGWEIYGYYLEEMRFYMDRGLFEYAVVFDGKLTDSDDFDEYEAVKPLKVKSITYEGLGNGATDLEETEN